MGRSVDYLNRAEYVTYINIEQDEEDDLRGDYAYFVESLQEKLNDLFPSLSDVKKWDGREVRIILDNKFCEIGISNYYDMWSVSIRVNDHYEMENIARNWINKIWPKVLNMLTETYGENHLIRKGGMSDGTSVYMSAKKTETSIHL